MKEEINKKVSKGGLHLEHRRPLPGGPSQGCDIQAVSKV